MRILITGNMGYVGPVVVRHLRRAIPQAVIMGYDSGYFGHCLTAASRLPETLADCQYFGDVRALPDTLLAGVDAVVYLAAVSNDPMGTRYEEATRSINNEACADIARRALAAGAKRFVFASSCSMYGFGEGSHSETHALNPLTAYSRSKVAAERALARMDCGEATVTSLRFATACGMSDRLRLDLVLNDFVAGAIAARRITVFSDGTPWRPLIDVKDMARAIEWALTRDPRDAGHYLAVNVGTDSCNYQVRQLADAVAEAIGDTTVTVNPDAPPDNRSYRVDFSLFARIAPQHQPRVGLEESIAGLKDGMEQMGFHDSDFRSSDFMRLHVLERHVAEGEARRQAVLAAAEALNTADEQ